ncbi:MAG: DNA alkylation repair protein [Candidatus Thioglobus sp.]|nr:DNA alkylation repair protein [Candidatus Thioglobus sp.]
MLLMAKFSLKDALFNRKKVAYLAALIKAAYPEFKERKFTQQILQQFPNLALKQRISCIRKHLEKHLPNEFEAALNIILLSLPDELDAAKTDGDFGDYIFAPLADFIAANGLENRHLNLSLNALAKITKRFSAEDSIRYFINQYPQQTFAFMQTISRSKNYHQRRLASEGLRPKLPWSISIDFDYQKSIQILDELYFDNTRFVVRSVANHLNDIAKFDADLVIKTLQKWHLENKQINQKEMDFLTRHALRTLVKQGNIPALKLLGYQANPAIFVSDFKLNNKQIYLGDYLQFSFQITSKILQKTQNLMLDYKIIYPSKGKKISAKVFKIKKIILQENESVLIKKKHLFKAMTTKKLHFGNYQIHLQINGEIFAKQSFCLRFL